MSSIDKHLKNLLLLADLTVDTELVSLKLVNLWERLREEHGLARLLLLLQQHIRDEQKANRQNQTPTSQESSDRSSEATNPD